VGESLTDDVFGWSGAIITTFNLSFGIDATVQLYEVCSFWQNLKSKGTLAFLSYCTLKVEEATLSSFISVSR